MSLKQKSARQRPFNTAAVVENICQRFMVYGTVGIATEMLTPVAYSPSGLIMGATIAAAADAAIQSARTAMAFARAVNLRRHLQAGVVTLNLASDAVFQPHASRGGRYKAIALAPQG